MGELLIDFLPIEAGGHTTGFQMLPGGSLLNVAVALARLGAPAAFAGKASSDYFGRFLRSYMEAEQVDTRFLIDSPAPSTLAFVAHEDGEPAFTFYGDGAADTLLELSELPGAFFEDTRVLHFGSISLLRGRTAQTVLAAVERLRGRALLSFDPNIRPGLVQDPDGYRALIDRLAGMVDIFKISAADLGWVSPDLPVEAAAARLRTLGPALVVITRGGKGGLALRGADQIAVPAFAIEVADTVGAGDTFNAGLLAALAERGVLSRGALAALDAGQVAESLRFASAAAALNCTRAGCDPPVHAEVIELLNRQ
jgi:fructokinase